jgi:hypothetical protein
MHRVQAHQSHAAHPEERPLPGGGGGIFNRRIELSGTDSGGTPQEVLDALRRLIDQDEVFAIVSPFTIGADSEAAALSESREVPQLIRPLRSTIEPRAGGPI